MAVVFAAIGIPAHFLLVLNLGLLLAVRLKRYGIVRRYRPECRDRETIDSMPMPMWVKVVPLLVLCKSFAQILLFLYKSVQATAEDLGDVDSVAIY